MESLPMYIGTKIIMATPATEGEVWAMKSGFTGDLSGHPEIRKQIEAMSDPGYRVVYEDGYVSWSPKDVFEKAYRPTTGMNFGLALEAVKMGHKISRVGWNGKGLFVVYQKGYPEGIRCNKQTADAWGMQEGDLFKCEPYLQINTVDGSHAMWVPSIRDCLADDWMIVGGEIHE